MTKKTLTLDASAAVREINKVSGAIERHNEAVKEAKRQTAQLTGRVETAKGKVSELGTAARTSATTMGKVATAAGRMKTEFVEVTKAFEENSTKLSENKRQLGLTEKAGKKLEDRFGTIGTAIGGFQTKVAEMKTATDELRGSVERSGTGIDKFVLRLNKIGSEFSIAIGSVRGFNHILQTVAGDFGRLSGKVDNVVGRVHSVGVAANEAKKHFAGIATLAGRSADRLDHLSSAASNAALQMDTFSSRMEAENTTMKENTRIMRVFTNQILGLTESMKLKNLTAAEQVKLMHADAEANKHASKSALELYFSFKNVTRILANFAIFGAFFKFRSELENAVKTSYEWARAISEIQTISLNAAESTERWQEGLVNLSNSFGRDTIENAEAAYQALSNQVAEGAEVFQFMAESTRLATISLAPLQTAVDTTTSIVHAFRMETEDASRINAILFKTVEEGRLRLGEMASTIGRVAILSEQLGVTFLEQQAALSLLTKQGIEADEALTLIRNLEFKLIRPTERMSQELEKMGFSSGAAAIKALGLVGTLEALLNVADASGDVAQEFGEIWGRLRATIGAVGLTQADFNGELKKFENAGVNAVEAFQIRMDALDTRANIQLQRLKNSFTETFGQPTFKFIVEMTEALGGTDQILFDLTRSFTVLGGASSKAIGFLNQGTFTAKDVLQTLITTLDRAIQLFIEYKIAIFSVNLAYQAFGLNAKKAAIETGQLTAAMKVAELSARSFQATRAAATFGLTLLIDVLVNAAFAAERYAQEMELAAAKSKAATTKLGQENIGAFKAQIDDATTAIENRFRKIEQTYASFIAEVKKANNDVGESIKAAFEDVDKSLKANIERTLDRLRSKINEIKGKREEQQEAVDRRKERVAEDKLGAQREEDVRALDALGGNELAKAQRLQDLKNRLAQQAAQAIQAQDAATFDRLNEQIDQLDEEIQNRLEKIKKDAEELVKTGFFRQEFEFDPETGQQRIRREQIEAPKDIATAQAAANAINALEAERLRIAQQRVQLEEQFIQRQEQALQQQKDAEQQRVKSFDALEDLLTKIDSFDLGIAGDPKQVEDFRRSVQQFGPLAEQAGLDPAARLELQRELNQKLLQIDRESLKIRHDQELTQVQKNLDEVAKKQAESQAERTKKQQELAETIKLKLPDQITEDLEALKKISEVSKAGFFTKELGRSKLAFGRDIVAPDTDEDIKAQQELAKQVQLVQRALEGVQGAKGFDEQSKHIDGFLLALERLQKQISKFNADVGEEGLTTGVFTRLGKKDGFLEIADGKTLQNVLDNFTDAAESFKKAKDEFFDALSEEDALNLQQKQLEEQLTKIPEQFRLKVEESLRAQREQAAAGKSANGVLAEQLDLTIKIADQIERQKENGHQQVQPLQDLNFLNQAAPNNPLKIFESPETVQRAEAIKKLFDDLRTKTDFTDFTQYYHRTQDFLSNAADLSESEKEYQDALDSSIASLREYITLLERANAAKQQGAGQRVQQAFGGHFAFGRDNIPAMLSRGESVLNAGASRVYGTLIRQLNAAPVGDKPLNNNITFGDINITVPVGSTKTQVDNIIGELQRRARAGFSLS